MIFLGRQLKISLRLKFILPISIMLVVSLTVIGSYLVSRQIQGFQRELAASGESLIKLMAINSESAVLFGSESHFEELLQVLDRFEAVRYAIISDADGRLLATRGIRSTSLLADSLATSSAGADTIIRQYVTDESGNDLLVLRSPVVTLRTSFSREQLGLTAGLEEAHTSQESSEVIGYLELGFSMASAQQLIDEATAAVVLLTVLVLIVTVLMLTVIINAITRPVRQLVMVTDQISRGDFSRKVGDIGDDELGHLAMTFNQMIDSLRQSRQEIEEYNRTLEEKIIERTQQLEDAQAQLIQSEKLSAIGQLAAGVAHELNNPLGGILGYAQFTLEKLQKTSAEKITTKELDSFQRYVHDIEMQARRCKAIVQNLLKFSRTSRAVDFTEIDINRTLEETVSFVEHQLHINQMTLTIDLGKDLPLLFGNAGQLQQVFTNLIINAMHASQPGAAVTVSSRFSPALGEFGGAVELQFADQGSGIPKENLKKIFEPFFTTKEIGKGTGLGLSVSYGIVKDHGGEISVSSVVGKGTTFTIVLPIQKAAPKADTGEQVGFHGRDSVAR